MDLFLGKDFFFDKREQRKYNISTVCYDLFRDFHDRRLPARDILPYD